MLTKGAIGNLINRYRAVLKKCSLINTFGSLAVAGMLVMGGAGGAEGRVIVDENSTLTIDQSTDASTITNQNSASADSKSGGAVSNKGTLTVQSVTLSGNKTPSWGGAIYNNAGMIQITNSIFSNNTADAVGGAIGNYKGKVTITGGSFTKNSAPATSSANKGNGGAIINKDTLEVTNVLFEKNSSGNFGGAIQNEGTAIIRDSVFTENMTSPDMNVGGGAINGTQLSTTTITNSDFSRNKSFGGGALGSYGSMTITDSRFDGNIATSENGGAAFLGAQSNTTVDSEYGFTGSTFKNNHAANDGGAIGTREGINANNSRATMRIGGATFEGNTAGRHGGALQSTFYSGDGVTLSSSTFTGNSAGKDGGAIHNSGNLDSSNQIGGKMTISDSTFTGNTAGQNGGAIYNSGQLLSFTGTNTFTNNTAAGSPNDIYNINTVTITNGTTTLNSGYIQDKGIVYKVTNGQEEAVNLSKDPSLTVNSGATLNTSTLDILAGTATVAGTLNVSNKISWAENASGALVINGGSVTAPVGNFLNLADYTAANGAGNAVDGRSGNLYLKFAQPTTYTADQLTTAQQLLFTPDAEAAVLGFLNATLELNEEAGEQLVVGGKEIGGTVTLSTTAPVVVKDGEATSSKTPIELVADNTVRVVNEDHSNTLLSPATINVGASEFTAAALQVQGDKPVTLEVNKADAHVAFTSAKGTRAIVVGEDGTTPVPTSITVSDGSLDLGIAGYDANRQRMDLEKVTVSGGGTLSALSSEVKIAELAAQGGTIFVDPAYVGIDTLANNALSSNLYVGKGSTVSVGFGSDDLASALQQAGIAPGVSRLIPANQETTVLALGAPVRLGGTAKLVVDAGVNSNGTVARIGAAPDQKAYFGPGSVLVVDSAALAGNAAITAANSASDSAVISSESSLVPVNLTKGDLTLLSDFVQYTDGTTPLADGDTVAGWNTSVQQNNPDRMLNASVHVKDTNKVVLASQVNTASQVQENFPGMDSGLVSVMTSLWEAGDNAVDSPLGGVKFLSRAARRDYLPSDREAAKTIESAARMGMNLVPHMTWATHNAASAAVTQRTTLARPGGTGLQSMPVDDSGFAMWLMPLYQNWNANGLSNGSRDLDIHANLGGLALGADYTFNDLRAGLTFNIGGGHAKGSGGINDTVNDFNFWGLGAYAGWTRNNFGLTADVNVTGVNNELEQDMPSSLGMNDLKSDIDSWALGAGLRGEYKLETSVLDIVPHAGVRYTWLNTDSYDVKSGGTVLKGDAIRQNIWTFPVGVALSKEFETENAWRVKPALDLAVIPAAGDVKARGDVRFTGVNGKAGMKTQVLDYVTYMGQAGLELGKDNISLGLNYNFQAGDRTTAHGVFGTFRYEF